MRRLIKAISYSFTVLLLALCAQGSGLSAKELSATQQRYQDAVDAWEKKDQERYQTLKKQLEDYVLYPYLEFRERGAEPEDGKAVNRFRQRYADTPLADRLHRKRLIHLGENEDWQAYYREYEQSNSKVLQCYYLRSVAAVKGKGADWLDQVESLWMTGTTLPKQCSPLFNDYYKTGAVTSAMLLQRIRLAMEKKNLSLARFLAKKLDQADKPWYEQWLKMHQEPLPTLMASLKLRDSQPLREMVLHGVKRYAREDTYLAWRLWRGTIKPNFAFTDEEIIGVEQALVLRAGWRHLPEANEMYGSVSEATLNEEARQWRIRSALRAQDWKKVLDYIARLPKNERNEQQWKYWKARAWYETGSNVRAKGLYEDLAGHTSYYGFLAAEQLNKSYRFTTVPVIGEGEESQVNNLARREGMHRARELFEVGDTDNAVREWNHQLRSLSKNEKRWAARLAQRWGWHFAAILTASQAGRLDDLELRFPLMYVEEVQREAIAQGIPDSWIYGVMRRESAFRETAESPAGALGLMQLMPGTAKLVAKKLGLPRPNRAAIKEPANNIRLGSSYLKQVQDQYDGHEVLATASYNAGPHRVRRWLPEEVELPADIWIDTITFDETRNYVKAVMFYSTIFDWKLRGKVRPLRERMQPVRPAAEAPAAS